MKEKWQELTEAVMTELEEWSLQHPKATLQEIEEELDERWARIRARMLQDLALASEAAAVTGTKGDNGPQCPECGHRLEGRGQDTRILTTDYNQSITLKRSYGVCPTCGVGLFPPG